MNIDMNRRRFLGLTTASVAALGLTSGTLVAQDAAPKRKLKKAYMLNSFPQAKGLKMIDKFKLLKAAGFQGVEPDSHLDRKEVAEAIEATGLEIASISCGDHSRMLSHGAPSERQKGVDGLLYALESAKTFGAKSILVVAGGVSDSVTYAQNYERTQAEIRKAIPTAEKLGVVMAIENVWNNFLLSPLEAARYVDEFNSPAVGWHFDIGNVMSIGWPEHWIRALGKRIKAVHVKEFSRNKMNKEGLRKGFSVEYLAGDNNWSKVMKTLDEVGYNGWAIVEPACGECKSKMEPAEYLEKVSEQLDKIIAA